MIELFKGCCLSESSKIATGSVDLILTDLPYGTMDGGGKAFKSTFGDAYNWDKAIDPISIFEIANRILRKNGRMVLFSQEPYTTDLINKALPNLPFRYRGVWIKDSFANPLGVNKAMVGLYEDFLMFSKLNPVHDSEFTHPLRPYFAKVYDFIGESKAEIIRTVGQKADHVFRFNSSQFNLCTEVTYAELVEKYRLNEMPGFKSFQKLEETDAPFRDSLISQRQRKNPSTFNLWEGRKFKSNVLNYAKDYDGYHPTQKPVKLLEDLIKTFSNGGDLVVDLTMGSGSTGVACLKTGRRFKGIEMSDKHFLTAVERTRPLADALKHIDDLLDL